MWFSELALECLSSVVLGQSAMEKLLKGSGRLKRKRSQYSPGAIICRNGAFGRRQCLGDHPENHPFPQGKPESPTIGSLLGIIPLGDTAEVRGSFPEMAVLHGFLKTESPSSSSPRNG